MERTPRRSIKNVPRSKAPFWFLYAVCKPHSNVFIADSGNHAIYPRPTHSTKIKSPTFFFFVVRSRSYEGRWIPLNLSCSLWGRRAFEFAWQGLLVRPAFEPCMERDESTRSDSWNWPMMSEEPTRRPRYGSTAQLRIWDFDIGRTSRFERSWCCYPQSLSSVLFMYHCVQP